MTSRERVTRILNHQEADRIAIDLGGRVASMHIEAYNRLKGYLGIREDHGLTWNKLWFQVEDFDERVLNEFDIDFRRVYLRGPSNGGVRFNPDGTITDEWGLTLKKITTSHGPLHEMIGHPLAEASLEDIESYSWPDPTDPARTKGLEEEVKNLYESTDHAIVAGAIGAGPFEVASWLRGSEQYYIDLLTNREFAVRLFEKVVDLYIEFYRVFLNKVGKHIQIIETSDDYGTQRGLLISPQLYKDVFKPQHKGLLNFIKSRTDAKIFHHSCGSVYDLIDELHDSGVDVLNPIQPGAAKMEPWRLKGDFGNKMIFHGGIDEQYLLPRGTPEEIDVEVHEVIRTLAPGGGYILAPAHNIQPDTPPENVVAMYKAAEKHGRYQ